MTNLKINNFKGFEAVDIELGSPAVFIGPNNSGKTSAMQALALWDIGLRRWNEKRSGQKTSAKRSGVSINPRDLVAIPVPHANLLWRDRRVRDVRRVEGKQRTSNVRIEITVSGVSDDQGWECGLEFDHADEEALYCRPLRLTEGKEPTRMVIPKAAGNVRMAFLPPLSGLASTEMRLDEGAVNVLVGEGRTAEVLRNLCYRVHGADHGWEDLVRRIRDSFGAELRPPRYIQERGEIAASHSEVVLNEAGDRDLVIAFVGQPHRLDERGSQLKKALSEFGFEHYYQAEQTGWVLYLEGSTDLSILQALAERAGHTAARVLQRPFVHYVGNQPTAARKHFHALREAFPGLRGIALFDKLGRQLHDGSPLVELMWERNEIENYVTTRRTLEGYAASTAKETAAGPLFEKSEQVRRIEAMREAINAIEGALKKLGKGSPWDPDLKVSNEFLDPLFADYFERLNLPNVMPKKSYYELARHVPKDEIEPEVVANLDAIVQVAGTA